MSKQSFVRRVVPRDPDTQCKCGKLFQFVELATGRQFWCSSCDGHATGCQDRSHVFGNCKVRPIDPDRL